MTDQELSKLIHTAAEMRLRIVRMMGIGKAHHFGGSLSATDIITALYFYAMKFDPANPNWNGRDRLILSKGHCVPVQYAALSLLGVIPIEELSTLKQLGSRLQGHPAKQYTPGIEGCTGALGEGLSYSNGIALACRIHHISSHVYCVIGDGELHEGQVWEAAMTASRQGLSNLTAIIDRNKLKGMDEASSCKNLDTLPERWATFGWAVREIDGHNMGELCSTLDWAIENQSCSECPSIIIANTIKGKGVSFMEGKAGFHNSAISEEQYHQAVDELTYVLQNSGELM